MGRCPTSWDASGVCSVPPCPAPSPSLRRRGTPGAKIAGPRDREAIRGPTPRQPAHPANPTDPTTLPDNHRPSSGRARPTRGARRARVSWQLPHQRRFRVTTVAGGPERGVDGGKGGAGYGGAQPSGCSTGRGPGEAPGVWLGARGRQVDWGVTPGWRGLGSVSGGCQSGSVPGQSPTPPHPPRSTH